MRRKFLKAASFFIVILMMLPMFLFSVSAEETTSNRYNVVFVLDTSGSLKQTDPNNLRFDATKLFLGLSANEGNYMGAVVFGDGIVKTVDIKNINGQNDKLSIEKAIESSKYSDWTDIGTALNKAVDMLNSKGNKDLESVIVFLSDGKTDLGNDEAKLKKSNENKSRTLNKARENNIKIHTVGLNSNGGADMKEIKQIAKATGGECEEVKSAADLKNVFASFYNLIYGTSATTLDDQAVPSNGKIEGEFSVPSTGVEEVNIIISAQNSVKNITLTKPDGQKLDVNKVKDMTITAKTFSVTKITNPESGTWKLYAEGKSGDSIKIEMVRNYNLTVDTDYNQNSDKTVTISGYLFNDSSKADEGYEDYEAVLHVKKQTGDSDDDIETEEIGMSVSGNSYIVEDYPIKDIGTYTFYMEVTGDGIVKASEPFDITIGNTVPEVKKEKIEQHFWVFPFFTKTGDIDLSGAVVDAEDKNLKYAVDSSSFKDESYELDGETLTIKDFFDLSEGSFTITATDSNGASAEFNVVVTTTNVGIIALIAIGAIILIVIALIVISTYIALNKRFMGDCYVSTFDDESLEYSEEVKRTKGRGRIRLSAFGVSVAGFDLSKCYLQASGKDYIEFVSPKPVYGGGARTKKVKITGMEVPIKTDANASSGIKVRFASRKNPNNGWY